jgi:hypothetical protein
MDWIDQAKDRNQRVAPVNTVKSLRFLNWEKLV